MSSNDILNQMESHHHMKRQESYSYDSGGSSWDSGSFSSGGSDFGGGGFSSGGDSF